MSYGPVGSPWKAWAVQVYDDEPEWSGPWYWKWTDAWRFDECLFRRMALQEVVDRGRP